MITEIQTLLAIRDRLTKEIEAVIKDFIKDLPQKQQLDAVNVLIESAEKPAKSSPNLNDSDAIMEAVVAYFEGNGNTPGKMKDVVAGAESQGVFIDSGRPGTTVAAIMTRSDKWKGRFKNKGGYWSLK